MKFRVVWKKRARNNLAEIWLASSNRDAVTQASAELDRRLMYDADTVGESREAGLRMAFARPLAVKFHVDSQNAKVTVISVIQSPAGG